MADIPQLCTIDDLTRRAGDLASLMMWARNDEGNINDAIAVASASVITAAANRHALDSLMALTAETLPADARAHTSYLALEQLTFGQGHPEDFDTYAKRAHDWLAFLATGTAQILGVPLLSSITGTEGGLRSAYSTPRHRMFDGDGYALINPTIGPVRR